jgi:hypothetical protein
VESIHSISKVPLEIRHHGTANNREQRIVDPLLLLL